MYDALGMDVSQSSQQLPRDLHMTQKSICRTMLLDAGVLR